MKRRRIFERDQYRCVYCGEQFAEDELTIDHVQPRVRRGDRSEGNLVTACRGCNTRKGHRRLSEFLRDEDQARANFLRLAIHVWPRMLRTLHEELGDQGTPPTGGDPYPGRTRRGDA